MKSARLLVALLSLVVPALFASAQSTEVALTGGGDFISNKSYSVGRSWGIEGSLAHRLIHGPLVGLYGEIPIAASFDSTPKITTSTTIPSVNYSTLFVTPGLKLKISTPMFDPYLVVGGGLGHFSSSSSGGSKTTGVVSYGGGVDVTLLPLVGLRGEIRDYNSGYPAFGFGTTGRQHNLFVTGGLVLRF